MAIGLTVIKRSYYKGVEDEEWSNHYHLTGTDPANATEWRTLFDALVTIEKTLYTSQTKVIRGYGYTSDAANATAVWSVDLTVSPNTPVAGTLSTSNMAVLPLDTAAWVRWKLDRLNTKGKAVYLRKYFHGQVTSSTAGGADSEAIPAHWKTAAGTFGETLRTGGIDNGKLLRDTAAASIIGAGYATYFTTRTLKRRGRRPPTV